MKRMRWVVLVAVLAVAGAANATSVFHYEDFNAGDGGYTAAVVNDPRPGVAGTVVGEWTHGPSGLGGSGAWATAGGQSGAWPTPPPFECVLTTPVIPITQTGHAFLDFDHLYNFEFEWDGGVVMVSKNGGAFSYLPDSAFESQGYVDTIQTDYLWSMAGLDAFMDSSGGFVHSRAALGEHNAGDTLQVQFRGGWDWLEYETPAWIVDSVAVTVPEPTTMALLGLGGLGLLSRRRRRR